MTEWLPGSPDKIRPYFLDDDMPCQRHSNSEATSDHQVHPLYKARLRFTGYWMMAMASSTVLVVAVLESPQWRPAFIFLRDTEQIRSMLGVCLLLFFISCALTLLPFILLLGLLDVAKPWLLYSLHVLLALTVMWVIQYNFGRDFFDTGPANIYGGMSVLYFFLFMEEWRKRDPEGYYK